MESYIRQQAPADGVILPCMEVRGTVGNHHLEDPYAIVNILEKYCEHDENVNLFIPCHALMQPPSSKCVKCTSAIEWVNTLPEDQRVSIIKHSRMVDRQFQQALNIPEAMHYYRTKGYDPRAQLRPTGQYSMLDPGFPIIQEPTCWSCQPKLNNEEYESLRSRALHDKLAAAGHPLPLIPVGLPPHPYDPEGQHGHQAKQLPQTAGPGILTMPSSIASIQGHEAAREMGDAPAEQTTAPETVPAAPPQTSMHVDHEAQLRQQSRTSPPMASEVMQIPQTATNASSRKSKV